MDLQGVRLTWFDCKLLEKYIFQSLLFNIYKSIKIDNKIIGRNRWSQYETFHMFVSLTNEITSVESYILLTKC